MRKAILFKVRTELGKKLRNMYDNHAILYMDSMRRRVPRTDKLANTLTSFTTDNLLMEIRLL